MPKNELSIVIPVYNSGSSLLGLVEEIFEHLNNISMEIILIDDASSDNSWEVLKHLKKKFKEKVIIDRNLKNRGEHFSIIKGLEKSESNFVLTMADDGQNPPAEIFKIYDYAKSKKLDAVYGIPKSLNCSRFRKWISNLANTLADIFIAKPKGLYISNFRCISKRTYKKINHNAGWPDYLIFKYAKSIDSVKVEHRERQKGKSGYSIFKILRFVYAIFKTISPFRQL